jgi:hypothetical protein
VFRAYLGFGFTKPSLDRVTNRAFDQNFGVRIEPVART